MQKIASGISDVILENDIFANLRAVWQETPGQIIEVVKRTWQLTDAPFGVSESFLLCGRIQDDEPDEIIVGELVAAKSGVVILNTTSYRNDLIQLSGLVRRCDSMRVKLFSVRRFDQAGDCGFGIFPSTFPTGAQRLFRDCPAWIYAHQGGVYYYLGITPEQWKMMQFFFQLWLPN